MVTLLLTVAEAELVELALSMVPRAAAILARLERGRHVEALLPCPVPPRLLVIETRDGADVVCEYYQDAQVDRIVAAIRSANGAPPAPAATPEGRTKWRRTTTKRPHQGG